jgi:hypothetical protein
MKVLRIDEERERLIELSQTGGGFSSEMPHRNSEFGSYIDRALELACKAYDYPWEADHSFPLGFRFDGYHQDGFTFTVFFRIDKDCPFMVRFDGIDHYDAQGQPVGQFLNTDWVATTTMILREEV